MTTPVEVVLGEGIFGWPRHERVTDRYGSVWLYASLPELDSPILLSQLDELPLVEWGDVPLGEQGQLVAEVIEGRESRHIGDLFRGIAQDRVPDARERFVLGSGELFVEELRGSGEVSLGVVPRDGRDKDWLDPQALYRLHDSVVRLTFEQEV